MPSRKVRLSESLVGVERVDWPRWQSLLVELAPISQTYLRKLLRQSGVVLTAEVEGVRQESFEQLERTLLATSDRRAVLEAKRHAEFARRSPNANRAVKDEMVEWMRVWLETPSAFPLWLKLRKATADFQALREGASPKE